MARAVAETSSWYVRAVIVGAVGLVVAMVGWTLVHVMANSDDNARKIAAIEARLMRMETDISEIRHR